MLDIAIVIVSWNVRDCLTNCLTSIRAEITRSGLKGKIWVVDNGSTDGTPSLLRALYSYVHLIENEENIGFGAANNQGMQAALAEDDVRYLFLLNPDTIVRSGALNHLISCLETYRETGMVGARLIYGDGRFQHSAFAFPGILQLAFDIFPIPWRLYESRLNGRYPRSLFYPHRAPFCVDFVLGATMLVRREVVETTQGFDESFHMYCEEIDWCWRIQEAGWQIRAVPQAEIVHFGGESTKQVPAQSIINLWQSRAQLYQKHHATWKHALARRVAQWGLDWKANNAPNPTLAEAYRTAATAWQ